MNAAEKIEHVVVLMLENRSFDCMLGKLYPAGPNFEGVTGNEINDFERDGRIDPVSPWSSVTIDDYAATIPDPDPGELFADMNEQLFGRGASRTDDRPLMSGFVSNFIGQKAADKPRDPLSVMHVFNPEQVPVISTLARSFAVCDQWHASAPCQTWPNRFFVHTGTCLGNVNNSDFPIPFPAPSIFARLAAHGRSWRVYFHDLPQSIMLKDLWSTAFLHYRFFGQFLADAHSGTLPNYTFIEPRYFADLGLEAPNDQHPPHDIRMGEKLIAEVYNTLRSSPCWKKSLLIITYDEHGGCFDHVPPPRAVSPDGLGPAGYQFTSYGVRVPAVVISPFVHPGSIIRSAPGGIAFDARPYPFDHSSIIATLRELFNLGAPLTERDRVAPSLLPALTLARPDNDGPTSIDPGKPVPTREYVRSLSYASPNHHQDGLSRMAKLLPSEPLMEEAAIPASRTMPQSGFGSVVEAGLSSVSRVKNFLGL